MSSITLTPRHIPLLLGAGGAAVILTACGQPGSGLDSASSPPETVTETATMDSSPENSAETTAAATGPDTAPPPGICPTDALDISLLSQQGAAGSVIHTLAFTNISDVGCELSGFPGVSYVGHSNGTQIGAAAVREGVATTQMLPLAPGEAVHADVRASRAEIHDSAACGEVVPVDGLRIYPPGNTESAFVPLEGMTGCTSEEVELLTVRPVTVAD